MPKLIVLSNRVGLPNSDKPVAGGLAIALKNALQENGGIWAGMARLLMSLSLKILAVKVAIKATINMQQNLIILAKIILNTLPAHSRKSSTINIIQDLPITRYGQRCIHVMT